MENRDLNLTNSPQKSGVSWNSWQGLVGAVVGIACAMTVAVFSVGAVSPTVGKISPTPAAMPTETLTTESGMSEAKVEYYLPYPGILPDSPLYKLKMVRDRVKLWFTWEERSKAGLELMYADKRVNAALALAAGNKSDLAVSTATKAEKYLEAATNRVIKLIKLGQDEKSLLLTLEKAVAKHEEILEEIENGGEINGGVKEALQLNRLLAERVGQTLLETK